MAVLGGGPGGKKPAKVTHPGFQVSWVHSFTGHSFTGLSFLYTYVHVGSAGL